MSDKLVDQVSKIKEEFIVLKSIVEECESDFLSAKLDTLEDKLFRIIPKVKLLRADILVCRIRATEK